MVGKIIEGKFQIVRLIESGGMGEVYEAVKLDDKSRVAVKLPHPHLARDAQIIQRFRLESKIACSVSHKNIVKGISCGNLDGRPFLVMEYIEGISVKQYLASKKKLPIQEAVNILLQAAEALDYLYRNKLIKAHRDIKPSNMMLLTDHSLKLMDFGVSKTHDESEFTKTKTQIGVINYVSPEQIKDPKRVDIHSDIWSLGVIFYELISGRKPFDGENEPSIIFKILYSAPSPLDGNVYEKACWEIIERQLQREPGKRFSSPGELLENLRQLEKNLRSGKNLPTITLETSLGRKRKKLLRTALVSLLIVAIAFGAWQLLLKNNEALRRELEGFSLKPDFGEEKAPENKYSPKLSFSSQPVFDAGKSRLSFTVLYEDRDGNSPVGFKYLLGDKEFVLKKELLTKLESSANNPGGALKTVYRVDLPLSTEPGFTSGQDEVEIAFKVTDGKYSGKTEIKYILLETGKAGKKDIFGSPAQGPAQPEDLK